MSRSAVDALLFVLLAALWGGSFVAIKYVVSAWPPAFGAMLRVALAASAYGLYFGAAQGRDLRASAPLRRRMWLAGLFAMGFPFAALFWGERRVSPGLAGIINGTAPLFAFVFGLAANTGETFTRRKAAGLLLGFAGILVICSPLLRFGGSRDEVLGTAAVFLMSACYAVGSLLTRSILSGAKADFRANAFHQACAAFVFLAAWSLATERWPSPSAVLGSPAALVSAAYLGLLSTALAFAIYFHLIREWGAVRAAAVTYVAPIFAVLWDYVFFKNVPPSSEIVGVAAVLSSVVILNAPARKKP